MKIIYENIKIDVHDHDMQYIGDMQFKISTDILLEFYDDLDGNPYFEEEREAFRDSEYLVSSNTDLFIVLVNLMKDYEEDFNIEYWGSFFWLFHDIGHAEEDVIGGIIHPSAHAENRANNFSLKQLKERGIEFDLSLEETEKFKEEFLLRFREMETELDIEELFYSDYYEDEDIFENQLV